MADLLFDKLIDETEEEKAILQNKSLNIKDLYTNTQDFIIQSSNFLENDSIMIRKHTRYIDFPKHSHDYIEMNFVYNGKLTQKIGNTKLTLKKGELIFLNQHIEHEIKASSHDDIILNFIIQPAFFENIIANVTEDFRDNHVISFLLNSIFDTSNQGEYLYFPVAHVASIQSLLKNILEEMLNKTLFSQTKAKFMMGSLIVELIEHSHLLIQEKETTNQQFLFEVFHYVEKHYKTASLQRFSAEINRPDYWVSKQIKKLTNTTFKELLQGKRLAVAKAMLAETTYSITTIAEEVGYENISYFYRIFKKKYGKTPKQLRKQ